MERQVEPDDGVGPREHKIAELPIIGAVDHPAVSGDDRLDESAQLVVGRLRPVRAVDERVELDELHAEPACELAAERRLAVPACTCDDRDPAAGRLQRIPRIALRTHRR